MTETTNGSTPNGSAPAAAAAPAKVAEAASPMPSAAATSGSEGQGSLEPAEKVGPPPPPRGAAVAATAAAGSIAAEAAAAAAAKTPIRGTAGRIKAPPSATASMQRQAFSHVDLSKLCWDMSAGIGGGDGKSNGDNGNGAKPPQQQAQQPASSNQPSAVATSGSSSSSSSSSAASDPGGRSAPAPAPAPTPVVERTVSRTGREAQRWATDPHTGQLVRLTTGCVPIMRDGRILFCSSSRKEAWILPKGGWESDETMEESALRETFEEAGVLGTLGPVLDEIEYETRKAKKRRLERANLIKTMMEELGGGIASTSGGGGGGASSWDEQHGAQHKAAHINGNGKAAAAVEAVEGAPPNGGGVPPAGNVNPKPPPPNDGSMSPPAAQVALSNAAPIFRIQQLQQLQHAGTHGAGAGNDDTASLASVASMASDTSTSCSRARMRLFPLYVSEVRNEWPESGRARKVLDIDAAIEMMESRPEFQRALIEVRDRRLHLTGPPAVPAPPVATGTGSEKTKDDQAVRS